MQKQNLQLNEKLIAAQTLQEALLVLEKGANINATHYFAPLQGDLNLFCPIWQGRLKIVQYLVENGANIRPKDQYLSMPLICSAWFGNLELVKLFIEKGIWLHGGDQHGNTALYYAQTRGYDSIANYLRSKGVEKLYNTDCGPILQSEKDHALINASRFKNLRQVKAMLEVGVNVDARDREGNTPLMWAIQNRNSSIVGTLLLAGADPNFKNHEKTTALICAGRITACVLIIVSNEFQRISQARKMACYAGVVPFKHRSGTSVKGRNRVSNLANKPLKSLLHMGAMPAIRSKSELAAYYDRQVATGKPRMSVINAVRNKIIRRVYACVRDGRLYEKKVIKTEEKEAAGKPKLQVVQPSEGVATSEATSAFQKTKGTASLPLAKVTAS